jgi:hypothetical protein
MLVEFTDLEFTVIAMVVGFFVGQGNNNGYQYHGCHYEGGHFGKKQAVFSKKFQDAFSRESVANTGVYLVREGVIKQRLNKIKTAV